MSDTGCTLRSLSGSSCCEVHACLGCGAIHLTIGPMTWRFQAERFLEIGGVIAESLVRYRALHLDESAQGGLGVTSVSRPQ
jgi:hypothetical protein